MKIQRNVIENIIQAEKCMCKDEMRAQLCAVRLTITDENFTVETCDGHKITRVNFLREPYPYENENEKLQNGQFYFEKRHIAQLKLDVKNTPKYQNVIETALPKNEYTFTWPDLSQFEKAFKNDNFVIAFNADYLAEIVAALRKNKKLTTVQIALSENGKLDAMTIMIDGRKALLMPVRMPK